MRTTIRTTTISLLILAALTAERDAAIERAARAEAERRFPARLPYNVEFERRAITQDAFIAGASWLAEHLLSDEAEELAPVLAEHDRQVAERAWDEGHLVHGADGWPREDGYCRIRGGCIAVNPYRKEQENTNA